MVVFRFLFILLIFFSLVIPEPAQATGVLVSPLRIVMEGRDRTATMRIINSNEIPVTYRIDIIAMEQDTSGNLRETDKIQGYQELMQMIRYSPRQVRLEPGAMQSIRIMLRKPSELKAGEYRGHIKVSPIPDTEKTASSTASRLSGKTSIDGLAKSLRPHFVRKS